MKIDNSFYDPAEDKDIKYICPFLLLATVSLSFWARVVSNNRLAEVSALYLRRRGLWCFSWRRFSSGRGRGGNCFDILIFPLTYHFL